MNGPTSFRRAALFLCVACIPLFAAPEPPRTTLEYTVSLSSAVQHVLHVRMRLAPGAAARDVQMPVWYALYQVRDFAEYVRSVRAHDPQGKGLAISATDKTTWHITGTDAGVDLEYDVYADDASPFGAQLNSDHCFLNLAEVLMYPVGGKDSTISVTFADVPAAWRMATALPAVSVPGSATSPAGHVLHARDYDHLVDSPVELGTFTETDFEQDGAAYRIVIHGDRADYDLSQLVADIKKVVAAETDWMGDRPYTQYVFIYHFPRNAGRGGMEHAYSTAITVNADVIRADPSSVGRVTVHEFFHLWNVKRIRPQSLEPIDYTRENYTTALWFSEGFTDTASEVLLVRAGLATEPDFLSRLARAIQQLQARPAHRYQSAEESSLDAWLEKYPLYASPERSVSYYTKGELIGVMLDLTVRELSGGRHSLRDLMRWMNEHYARQNKLFPDTAGVREAAEAVTGKELNWFFKKYVSGTDELPYDSMFQTVGLRLIRRRVTVPDLGFESVRNFDAPNSVISVVPGSLAEKAGLSVGDQLLTLNGKPVSGNFEVEISAVRIGESITLGVAGTRGGRRDLKYQVFSRQEDQYQLQDADNITAGQRARRAAWMRGDNEPAGAPAR